MNEHAPALPEPDAAARAALDAAQEALAILIRLHDREADAALITGLKGIQAGTLFAALLGSRTGKQAAGLLQSALDALPEAADPHVLDRLAVDYAEIYLTNGFRIAPEASVWLTEEGLERQEPMFEVRDWYAHYGIAVPDWRKRADDHIVHELQFVAFLLAKGSAVAIRDAARFLDRCVLPWVPQMGRRVAQRAETQLYAATGMLTAELLEALRAQLEQITGEAPNPRPVTRAVAEKTFGIVPAERPYVPGLSESW